MDAGKNRAAMEEAGFGIRLDLARPDGYLLLGELNLREGDLLEARRSFAAAAKRAQGVLRAAALAGLARVHALAGELSAARASYEEALREDRSDPLNVRAALLELLVQIGDAKAALAIRERCEDESVDVFLASALAHFDAGLGEEAIVEARRACLENLYLAPLLRGEEAPDLGLAHGIEEASPEHALALLDRLAPHLRARPEAVATLQALARARAARREWDDLTALARRLAREPDEGRRAGIKQAIRALRDPARILATNADVLRELIPPPRSFDV